MSRVSSFFVQITLVIVWLVFSILFRLHKVCVELGVSIKFRLHKAGVHNRPNLAIYRIQYGLRVKIGAESERLKKNETFVMVFSIKYKDK